MLNIGTVPLHVSQKSTSRRYVIESGKEVIMPFYFVVAEPVGDEIDNYREITLGANSEITGA